MPGTHGNALSALYYNLYLGRWTVFLPFPLRGLTLFRSSSPTFLIDAVEDRMISDCSQTRDDHVATISRERSSREFVLHFAGHTFAPKLLFVN